ncbi:MAG TPA: CPBP family intramembrane glutamic endopeptidase [Puia sp.]|nr:CPBP family intramembrane glutamic endopeptidase [Puia sp.]
MHTYLRNKPAWLQLIIFGGLTFGLLLLASLVGGSIIARIHHMTLFQISTISDFGRPEYAGIVKGLLIVNAIGIFILPPLVFSYLADPHPLTYLGIRPPQKSSFLLIGMITMIAAYFAVEMLASLNESMVYLLPKSTQQWILKYETDANGQMKNILSMKTPVDLLMTILLAGALPAISEELFFRGILQKLFIQICRAAWPGIIFTAILFSAFHMQFMGFIPRMALGVILGALYWYSGSIYTSMLGHFIFNSINVFLIYYKVADLDSNTSINLVYILIGLASVIVIIFLIKYLRKQSVTSYAAEFPPVKEYNIFDEPDERV